MKPRNFFKAALFLLLVAFSLCLAQASPQEEKGNAETSIKLPFIGMSVPIKETYRTPIILIVILLTILYYAPKIAEPFKSTFSKHKFDLRFLEKEKMKYEILKNMYEIEALKKQHDLKEIPMLPDRLMDEKYHEAKRTKEAFQNTILQEAITRQQTDVSQRQLFVVRRLIAWVIDYFMISILFMPVVLCSTFLMTSFHWSTKATTDLQMGSISLIAVGYFILMWKVKGATVGKIIVRLKIARLDNQPLTYKDVFIRFFLWIFTNCFFALGFFTLFWSKSKQTLYDKLIKAVVVKV